MHLISLVYVQLQGGSYATVVFSGLFEKDPSGAVIDTVVMESNRLYTVYSAFIRPPQCLLASSLHVTVELIILLVFDLMMSSLVWLSPLLVLSLHLSP